MKHLLFFAVIVSLVYCSTDEETSTTSSVSQTSSDAVACSDIPLKRADVNQDGIINILDLTAVSCHFGQILDSLQFDYYALLYLPGGYGRRAGSVAVGNFFSVSANPIIDWNTAPPQTYTILEEERNAKYSSKRIEVHDSTGKLVDGVLGFWQRGGNIFSNERKNNSPGIDNMFFLRGAENKDITHLAFFFGSAAAGRVDIEVTPEVSDRIRLHAKPAAYLLENGETVARTSYYLIFTDPNDTELVEALMKNEEGIELATVDADGTVLQSFDTKHPVRGWSSGSGTGSVEGSRYYRADVYSHTCEPGQMVLARLKGENKIHQGVCVTD